MLDLIVDKDLELLGQLLFLQTEEEFIVDKEQIHNQTIQLKQIKCHRLQIRDLYNSNKYNQQSSNNNLNLHNNNNNQSSKSKFKLCHQFQLDQLLLKKFNNFQDRLEHRQDNKLVNNQ